MQQWGQGRAAGKRQATIGRRTVAAVEGRTATRSLEGIRPAEVTTDRAPANLRVLDEQLPAALHVVQRYANNPIEADHGRLKARLRPMRGLQRLKSAQTVPGGHAFVQNLHRDHYEIAADEPVYTRLRVAFEELAQLV
jgi:transposase-like protein